MQTMTVAQLKAALETFKDQDTAVVYGEGLGILDGQNEVLSALMTQEADGVESIGTMDAGRGECTSCSCKNFTWASNKLRCTCGHGKTNHLKS